MIQTNNLINSNTSSLSTSSSSSSQKNGHRPVEIQDSHFHQFQNIRCRFEKLTSNGSNNSNNNNSSSNNVRRYTSENNLNVMNPSSNPSLQERSSRAPPVQTTATSTEDLTTIPSWKKLSPQARLSALLDKTNHLVASPSLNQNGTSASLIDLSSIDKLPSNQPVQTPSRPRFRFVPSSDQDSILKEEPEFEQPLINGHKSYDNFDMKALLQGRPPVSNNNAPSSSSTTTTATTTNAVSNKPTSN